VAGGSKRAIIAAFFANLGIAIAKFIGFVFTRSSSLLAEGVHSLADTGNQGLLLLGGRKAQKEPTAEHPFGFGRERYFWSFIVSMVLFTLGGLFAIFEGVEKLRHPHELESPGWAIAILLVATVLEALSLRTAIGESNSLRGDASWFNFIRRAKVPELPVVLLEDFGALIGLAIALCAVSLAAVTGEGSYDGWGSILIGILLCVIALFLSIEMKSLLIGESASLDDQETIRRAMLGGDDVRQLIHLRTEHLGPEELLVAAKVEFDPTMSIETLAASINELEVRVRSAMPSAHLIYIEPDLARSGVESPPSR